MLLEISEKAAELNCESIAFPLIATGVYGFPKDMALEIAVSTFGKFLAEHEMNIILAVFDKESFQLSSQIVDVVDSYIDENYVNQNYAENILNHFAGTEDQSMRIETVILRIDFQKKIFMRHLFPMKHWDGERCPWRSS